MGDTVHSMWLHEELSGALKHLDQKLTSFPLISDRLPLCSSVQ